MFYRLTCTLQRPLLLKVLQFFSFLFLELPHRPTVRHTQFHDGQGRWETNFFEGMALYIFYTNCGEKNFKSEYLIVFKFVSCNMINSKLILVTRVNLLFHQFNHCQHT